MSHTSELFNPDAPLTESEREVEIAEDDGKFRVIVIPQNPWAPLCDKMLPHDDDQDRLIRLKELVGGYLDVIHTEQLLLLSRHLGLPSTQHIAMLVDEDGYDNRRGFNPRASFFYPGNIVGDTVLIIYVRSTPDDYDLISLSDQVTIEAVTKWVLDQTYQA